MKINVSPRSVSTNGGCLNTCIQWLGIMVDIQNEKTCVFNIRLAKLTGFYQILDPETIKCRGRNAYQIFVAFVLFYLLVISIALFVSCLSLWTYYTSMSVMGFLEATNSFYACYKMWIVIYRSNDIWKCLSITRYGFTSLNYPKRDGQVLLDRWRARSVWYTDMLAGTYCFSVVFYVVCCLAFSNDMVQIKNHDGSIGNFRQNVLNLYFFASDETYNEYYKTLFVFEALFMAGLTIAYLVFDILLLTLCLAIQCQMQMICAAFESVNHKSLSDPHSSAIGRYEFTSICRLIQAVYGQSIYNSWTFSILEFILYLRHVSQHTNLYD